MAPRFTIANDPCCICGSSQSEFLYEIPYPQHKYPGMFVLRQCKSCGLIFNSPRLDDSGIRKLYNENYYFFQRQDAAEFKRIVDVYLRTAALVEDTISERRVLEIGCGKGYLLVLLKKLGWEIEGVEISSSAVNYARNKFGIEIFNGSLEEYDLYHPNVSYPLVLAIDLIEHVPDPRRFVGVLKNKVGQNGLLIIDTPNGDAHNISVCREKWKGFNPFHIYIFNIANLTRLLEEYGFSIVNAFSYGNEHCKVYEEIPPVENKAKTALKQILSNLKLLKTTQRIHRFIRSPLKEEFDCETTLSQLVERIRKEKNYFNTPDSRGKLAPARKGDNFVLLAGKKVS